MKLIITGCAYNMVLPATEVTIKLVEDLRNCDRNYEDKNYHLLPKRELEFQLVHDGVVIPKPPPPPEEPADDQDDDKLPDDEKE